jgi:hypothetical protein
VGQLKTRAALQTERQARADPFPAVNNNAGLALTRPLRMIIQFERWLLFSTFLGSLRASAVLPAPETTNHIGPMMYRR